MARILIVDDERNISEMIACALAPGGYEIETAAGGPAAGLGPYLVASLVWGIGLSLGGTTG